MDTSTVLEQIRYFLDNLPVGTLMTLSTIGVVLYAYVTGSVDIDEAFKYLGLGSGSAAAVGIMRTHAGKGTNR